MTLVLLFSPVLAPVMLVLAGLIKAVSPGPVLFRQERVGLGGRRFICLKFRTMHAGAPTVAHERYLAELMRSGAPMTKLDGADPRLIPLAWALRSTGLDELPQILNVLRGEMSLVGPRPSTLTEYASFTPQQRLRTGALPGLTGLWQVNGKNRTTFPEMIDLDVRYVGTSCLWLDLGILFRTPVVLVEQLAEALARRRLKARPQASHPGTPSEVPDAAPAPESGSESAVSPRPVTSQPVCTPMASAPDA